MLLKLVNYVLVWGVKRTEYENPMFLSLKLKQWLLNQKLMPIMYENNPPFPITFLQK